MRITYDRNVELTDDIFCIAYHANYKLAMKRHKQERHSVHIKNDPNKFVETKQDPEENHHDKVVTSKLASSLFGKSVLVFSA